MHVHCNNCHHEWECTSEDDIKCDWCGGGFYSLEETPITGVSDIVLKLESLNNSYADRIIRKLKEHPKKKK